jgi:hypothetical protein
MFQPKFWVNSRRTQVAKGQRSASQGSPTPPAGYDPSPSPLCLQATRANKIFPAKIRLRKWERQNNTAVEINDKRFNLQAFKYIKQKMFITYSRVA